MEIATEEFRQTNARRGVSLLIVVALALQVGLGLGESSALLRESAGQTHAIRALAEAVVRYASKPVKEQEESPARVSARELEKLADRGQPELARAQEMPLRMLLIGLLALPPPVC